MKEKIRQAAILLFWLLMWQAAAAVIDNDIIFVGPADVAVSLFTQAGTGAFYRTIFTSLSRICLGFLSAFFAALILGSLSCRFSFLRELLSPVMLFFKSVPVASFVILALIWMGSKNLSVFISFVVVLPMIYTATLSGLKSADKELLEMAQVFRLPLLKRIKAIYLPALIPYLMSSVSTALGMSIKSGVAAEVIGVPDFSIGARLYTAKIYLSTADLFAWTLVIIGAAWLFERGFLQLLRQVNPAGNIRNTEETEVRI